MKPSTISIIIPVYNTAGTLDRCVESVIRQAGGCELILVDDGSPDGAGKQCDQWALRYPSIHVIHQENRGLGAARNAGIMACNSPYVIFVDSDDALAPGTLPGLLAEIKANPEYDVMEYPIELHYASAESKRLYMDGKRYTDWHSYWLDAKAYAHTYACNKVFRRSLFNYSLFPVGKAFEDVWLMSRLLPHCQLIATVNVGCYRYYDNPHGITRNATGADLASLLSAHCQILPLVSNAHYYAQVVNIALDVYHATGQVPLLPRMSYWQTPKLLVNKLIGLRLLCLLHQLLRPRH